jgi:hypothetical protein
MWLITKDCCANEADGMPSRTGVHSNDYDAERFAKADVLSIRLLDDDGELIYEALATRKRILDSPEDRAFELLDWCMADAGCTELQYFDDGQWQTL